MALQEGTKLINKGPYNKENGAEVLRLVREDQEDLDLGIGAVVTVGDDITEDEGYRLIQSSTWRFEEVGSDNEQTNETPQESGQEAVEESEEPNETAEPQEEAASETDETSAQDETNQTDEGTDE